MADILIEGMKRGCPADGHTLIFPREFSVYHAMDYALRVLVCT